MDVRFGTNFKLEMAGPGYAKSAYLPQQFSDALSREGIPAIVAFDNVLTDTQPGQHRSRMRELQIMEGALRALLPQAEALELNVVKAHEGVLRAKSDCKDGKPTDGNISLDFRA